MIKQHELFQIYEIYIDEKNISQGKKILLKMSKSSFDNFIDSYQNNFEFKDKIDELAKSEFRNSKIKDLFDDEFFTEN
jgi:hypothetical protein